MVLVKGVRFAENPMALGSGIKDCNLLGEIAIFDGPRSKIQDLTRSLGTILDLGSWITKDCNLLGGIAILDHKRLQSLGEIAILPDCNPSRLLSFKFVVEGLYEF